MGSEVWDGHIGGPGGGKAYGEGFVIGDTAFTGNLPGPRMRRIKLVIHLPPTASNAAVIAARRSLAFSFPPVELTGAPPTDADAFNAR